MIEQGHALGGGSSISRMNYERGDIRDYDKWEYLYGATGWNGEQMFEYFRADENNADKWLRGTQFMV